jgi:carbamate kinase
LLALQNQALDADAPWPLDVLVAESQGMIGYMLAQRLAKEPDMPPITTVLTRIEVAQNDPAFDAPEKIYWPGLPAGAATRTGGQSRLADEARRKVPAPGGGLTDPQTH